MANDLDHFLSDVRDYWRKTHFDYLAHVGTTFQAGYLRSNAPQPSNVELARAARIMPGDLVLDAGCGVGGPALDIAGAIASVRIVGVTISAEQAAEAQRLIQAAGFQESVRVFVADYHHLPLCSNVFDVVCLFESAVYVWDPDTVFGEALRVLRPGGRIYIKDVFQKARILSERARSDVEEFQNVFTCRVRSIAELAASVGRAGFARVEGRDITQEISTVHARHAMFSGGDLRSGLTSFGKKHFRFYWELPLCFGEIKAVKPA